MIPAYVCNWFTGKLRSKDGFKKEGELVRVHDDIKKIVAKGNVVIHPVSAAQAEPKIPGCNVKGKFIPSTRLSDKGDPAHSAGVSANITRPSTATINSDGVMPSPVRGVKRQRVTRPKSASKAKKGKK